MGEFKAGALFVWLCVYFMVLISGLSIGEFVSDKYDLDFSITTNGNESLLEYNRTISQCNEPRIKPFDGQQLNVFKDTTLCEYTTANVKLDTCDAVSGCTLTNNTVWFIFETDEQYCGGAVNLTDEFGINETLFTIDGSFATTDVPLYSLLNTQEQCTFFGLTWTEDDNLKNDISMSVLFDVVGGMFTYQASFTDDYWLDLILTTILFYLPFIILMVALYFALPFVH